MDIKIKNSLKKEIDFLKEYYNTKAVTTSVTALIRNSEYLIKQADKTSLYARQNRELKEQIKKLINQSTFSE